MTTSTSCATEGCTDPNAENFDPDADNDDGTCVLAREKFLGSYSATETCTNQTDNYTLTISESANSDAAIVIGNIYNQGASIIGTVTGDTFTFNQTENTINYSGTGTISGNTLTINFTASLSIYEDVCSASCIKQ